LLKFAGIRLTNVRSFEGEHFIPLAPEGLTVLMGVNNAGKSTVLRAPFIVHENWQQRATYCRAGLTRSEIAVQVQMSTSELEPNFGINKKVFTQIPVGGSVPNEKQLDLATCPDPLLVDVGWVFFRDNGALGHTLRFTSLETGAFLQFSNVEANVGRAKLIGKEEAKFTSGPGPMLPEAFQRMTRGLPFTVQSFAHWAHHRPTTGGKTDWLTQVGRRVVDTEEAALQKTLTFIRLKRPVEFDRISQAAVRAFPEFRRLDFIEDAQNESNYRPGFTFPGREDTPLARDEIGSGAWTFLCILTAARAAKLSGARLLMLDEPHLYLHPGLERLLIEELLDPAEWDGKPLQIVAATHSPTFVNAAAERGVVNVLDWSDDRRTSVSVRAIQNDEAHVFDTLVSQPSDLLYADRLVFVEGPSDVVALKVLARERCGVPTQIRYVPMRESDSVTTEIGRYFSVIRQGHGLGFRTRGLLVLDRDKEEKLTKKWSTQDGFRDPTKAPGFDVVWVGRTGNDIESSFCFPEFLVEYFKEKGVPADDSRQQIDEALAHVREPAPHTGDKGCTAISSLHEKLLETGDEPKANDLESLMRFYADHADEACCVKPKALFQDLETKLRSLAADKNDGSDQGR
jgi:hypothetical protein